MKAFNKNNPSLHLFYYGVIFIPVLLHIYCPHPLSCCIYTAFVSLLFATVILISSNIIMEMFYSLVICENEYHCG